MYLEAVYTNKILLQALTYDDQDITRLCKIYVIAEEMIDAATKNLVLQDMKRAICLLHDGCY